MNSLAINTSNQALTVTIGNSERILGSTIINIKQNHSVSLMPTIDALMESVLLGPNDIQRVIVAKGPGSYTGLRIGVTTAKTLAWTLQAELVAVSSLAVLAANCPFYQGYIVPLFNARRQNVYTGIYQWKEGVLVNIHPDFHTSLEDWCHYLKELEQPVLVVGEDVVLFDTCLRENLPEHSSSQLLSVNTISGVTLLNLGLQEKPVTDIEGFIPTYHKMVEAEEKWLENHTADKEQSYVEKI